MIDQPAGTASGGDWCVEGAVVTHDPDLERFAAMINSAICQVRRIIVIDNGSANVAAIRSLLASLHYVELIELGDNHGIAAALNVALTLVQDGRDVDWLLTLDQDTVLHERAVSTILDAYADLDPERRDSCAILAMRHVDIAAIRWPWKWLDSHNAVPPASGPLREVRTVITSGNLLRVDAVAGLRFDEALFMDQVDMAWSALVRRHGWRIFESRQVLMDHRLGTLVTARGRKRRYWGQQRLYYIVRNSSVLLYRGDLSAAEYTLQLVSHIRTHLWKDGLVAVPRCAITILIALIDALTGRMGRREYAFTRQPGISKAVNSELRGASRRAASNTDE